MESLCGRETAPEGSQQATSKRNKTARANDGSVRIKNLDDSSVKPDRLQTRIARSELKELARSAGAEERRVRIAGASAGFAEPSVEHGQLLWGNGLREGHAHAQPGRGVG